MAAHYHQDIVSIDLDCGNIHRCFLHRSIGTGDSNANRFGVRVFRGKDAVDLSGVSCQGYFRNSNGENIALTSYGTVEGNKAFVTLPQACYNYEGQFTLAIKLVGGGITGTMRIIDGMVDNTNTGSAVAPTESVPTYQEVLAAYEEVAEAIADVQDLKEDMADLKDITGGLDKLDKTSLFFHANTGYANKTILLSDGTAQYNAGYDSELFVTDFLMISDIMGMKLKNAEAWTNAGAYPIVFYDKDKEIIGTAYTPDSIGTKHAVTIELTASLIANYTGAKYCRIGGNSAYGTMLDYYEVINSAQKSQQMKKTKEYINSNTGVTSHQILMSDGSTRYDAGYPEKLYTTDYLVIDEVIGMVLKNAEAWVNAGAYPIAFYDEAKKIIGTAYTPDETTGQHSVNIEINNTLLSNYPGATYIRIGGNKGYGTKLVVQKGSIEGEPYPTYKINAYPKIFFGGDSVTQGFVIEGTEANPSTIYQEMPEQSYPACFGRIYAGADITKIAQSGISPYGYYYNKYPNIDFSEYNLIIIELGLNGNDHGYLNMADIDTQDTNTWCYKKLVQGIRNQNSDAQIALVRSQHFMGDNAKAVLEYLCTTYNCLYIDLHNTEYLDLDDAKYHGYYDNDGTPEIDWAHFTRRGYAAKAYVVARLLGDNLP